MKVRAITRQIQIKDIVFNLQDTKILFESSQCLGEEGGEERGRGACKLCWDFSYGFCHLLWENPAREKQERILKLTEKDLLKGTLLSVKLPMRPEKAPWARPLSHSFAYEMLFVSEAAVYFYLGGYSCQLSPDYWSVRSKWRSQSYHKDRSTTIEGDFQHSPSLPQNFNLWVNTAIYIFFCLAAWWATWKSSALWEESCYGLFGISLTRSPAVHYHFPERCIVLSAPLSNSRAEPRCRDVQQLR